MKILYFLSIFQIVFSQVIFPDDPITTKKTTIASTKVQASVPNTSTATALSSSTLIQSTTKSTASSSTISSTTLSSTSLKASTNITSTTTPAITSSTTNKPSTSTSTTTLITTTTPITASTTQTFPTTPTTTVDLGGVTTPFPPTGAKSVPLTSTKATITTTEETEEAKEESEYGPEETEEESEETEPKATATSSTNVTICAALGQCQKIGGKTVFDSNRMDVRISNPGGKPNSNLILGSLQKLTTPAQLGTPTVVQNQASCPFLNMTEICNLPNGLKCGIQFDPVPNAPSKSGFAKYNAYPWEGLVMKYSDSDKSETFNYIAAGAVLDHKHFLTTASSMAKFVYSPYSIKVRLGDWNLASTSEPFPYQELFVDQVIIHDAFDQNTLENNIAILKLSSRVPLGQIPTISHVCLPSNDLSIYNLRCVVAGFGKENKNGDTNFIIRDIDMPILNSTYCQSVLRNSILGPNYNLSDSWICAGGELSKATCDGDSGDPLVCNIAGQFYVVGLASWAPADQNCGAKAIPELFVNVFKYIPWIQHITSEYQASSGPHYSYRMAEKSPNVQQSSNKAQSAKVVTDKKDQKVAAAAEKTTEKLTTKNIETTNKKSKAVVAKNAATKSRNQTTKAASLTTKKMGTKQ